MPPAFDLLVAHILMSPEPQAVLDLLCHSGYNSITEFSFWSRQRLTFSFRGTAKSVVISSVRPQLL